MMFRKLILAIAMLVPSVAQAQLAIWIPTSGDQGVGIAIGADGKTVMFTRLVTVNPTPPVPPSPVVPVRVSGLYVLGVHNPMSALDQPQNDVMSSAAVKGWLAANCAKDSAGTVAARALNSTVDVSREVDGAWKTLLSQKSPAGDPYVVLIDDKHIAVEAMAATPTAAIARLQAFRGGAAIAQGQPDAPRKPRDEATYFVNDTNWKHVVGDGTVVDFAGHKRFLSAKVRRPYHSVSALTLPQAGLKVFTEAEIKARIAVKNANKSWMGGPLSYAYDWQRMDQNGYGQCWAFGPCVAFRAMTAKQGGIIRTISPNALARDSGYSNWGSNGGDPSDSVGTICSKGCVRTDIWPADSSGHSTKWDTPSAKADYEHNRVSVCVEIPGGSSGFLQVCSALVQDCPLVCTWDWWNHVTAATYLELSSSGEILVGIENSWGSDYGDNGFGTLGGSKKYSSATWAFVEIVQSTTVPAKSAPLDDVEPPSSVDSPTPAVVTPKATASAPSGHRPVWAWRR